MGPMIVKCKVCEENFEAWSPHAITCSNKCRQRLKRWRAEDRRRYKAALATISGLHEMFQRGLEPDALEKIVEIRDTAHAVLDYLKRHGVVMPSKLL